MPDRSGVREAMYRAQLRVMRAVLTGDDPPPGFDRFRLEVAHDGVLRKRAWCVAAAWPAMCRALGPRFLDLLTGYVRSNPCPPVGGSIVDGRLFAAYLAGRRSLPDAGRVQAMSFDLHHTVRAGRAIPRRGPSLRWLVLGRPPYLVIGTHLPGRPARVLRIPLTRRRMAGS